MENGPKKASRKAPTPKSEDRPKHDDEADVEDVEALLIPHETFRPQEVIRESREMPDRPLIRATLEDDE